MAGVSPAPPTLTIHPDGAVRGHTGVNHLSATADPARWPAGGFALSEIAHTEMAGPPEAMALERRYLDALRRANAYLPGTRTLDLLDDREVVLRFERVEPPLNH